MPCESFTISLPHSIPNSIRMQECIDNAHSEPWIYSFIHRVFTCAIRLFAYCICAERIDSIAFTSMSCRLASIALNILLTVNWWWDNTELILKFPNIMKWCSSPNKIISKECDGKPIINICHASFGFFHSVINEYPLSNNVLLFTRNVCDEKNGVRVARELSSDTHNSYKHNFPIAPIHVI